MGIFKTLHEAASNSEDHAKKLAYVHAMAQHVSQKEGVIQHVNKNDHDEGHHVSDWYDHEKTVATYNKGKLRESTELTINEEAFKHVPAIPGHHVAMSDSHRESLRKLKDGEIHKTHGEGIAHKTDSANSVHLVQAHRDGDVVHIRDHFTNKHIATVKHSDL